MTDAGVRRRPLSERFTSPLHSPQVSVRIGRWLAICFGICLVTGLISSLAQLPDPPFPLPTRPAWGYRLTQGLHVTTGLVAIPLLLVKLWSVYPLFFRRIARRGRALVLDLLERASIAVLVASALFQLTTGLLNVAQWYPWSFDFRSTHYAVGFIAVGALLVHIAVKLPIIRDTLRGPVDEPVEPDELDEPAEPADEPAASQETESRRSGTLSRRSLIRTSYAAAGVLALANLGSTVPALRRVSPLAVRSGNGPQGIPINRTAAAAQVTDADSGAGFRLELRAGATTMSLTMDDLRALPQHTAELPIACVEGWSASGRWTGVRLRDLSALVGAPPESALNITSMQRRGAYASSVVPPNFAADPLSLLALDLAGAPLTLDHGAPCRIIAPNRPGVLQTKWVQRIEVLG